MLLDSLVCGFDENNSKIYGLMAFDLKDLPNPNNTVITNAYIQIKNERISKTEEDIRYNIEFIDLDNISYESIKNREKIEFIGYEISKDDLKKTKVPKFIFDDYSCKALENINQNNKIAYFLIKPTASDIKNHIATWHDINSKQNAKLVINYIHKRTKPLEEVTNFKITTKNKKVKLTWNNPTSKDFAGVVIVRNRFHKPSNHIDGDKIYAGSDSYAIDNLGNIDISKYYAIFTYDNVPNYSKSVVIKYEGKF